MVNVPWFSPGFLEGIDWTLETLKSRSRSNYIMGCPSWEIMASTCLGIESLSAKEQDIVLRCMKATSAHVNDWEKHSRLGLEADDLHQVIARWPNFDDRDENGNDFLAINNCMNEVCNGFQIASVEWSSWFDTPMSEIESTYRSGFC